MRPICISASTKAMTRPVASTPSCGRIGCSATSKATTDGRLHGWFILDKPLGLSSAQGVAAIKRLLREAGWPKVKIGHGGTLDPLATGVLPIAIGEATKLAGRMLDATKGYRFTVTFGTATATDDAEGEV